MQFLECNIGNWKAEARIQDADNGKIMAVISTQDKRGANVSKTAHTVVFDHQPGCDRIEETKVLLRKILQDRYGTLAAIG